MENDIATRRLVYMLLGLSMFLTAPIVLPVLVVIAWRMHRRGTI